MHDIREKQKNLEPRRDCERLVREESDQERKREVGEYSDVGYHLNSPARLDEVVQHFKTSSTKCHSSQGESDDNVTDNGDKRIDISSKESE